MKTYDNPEARDPRTSSIIGAAMEVHRELGCGFLESAYHEALAIELRSRGIPFQREVPLRLIYKGSELRCRYIADMVCYDSIIVELKAVAVLGKIEQAQVINYLKVAQLEVGLLINFGSVSLQFKRFIKSPSQSA